MIHTFTAIVQKQEVEVKDYARTQKEQRIKTHLHALKDDGTLDYANYVVMGQDGTIPTCVAGKKYTVTISEYVQPVDVTE